MSYRIAVCDDKKEDAEYVAGCVEQWARLGGRRAKVRIFPSAEAFLFEYSGDQCYDLLLLDVEMGAMDGVSLAKELRRNNDSLQIIFVTGYSDYITEGYEVSALHYLVKPVNTDKLFRVLDRAADRLCRDERTLDIRAEGGLVRISVRKIRYVDVQLNYITIHADTEVTVKMPLSEMAQKLDERFYRVGRSAIVNLTCIRNVSKTEICLNDGARIPLPRGAYNAINRAIMDSDML